MRQHRNLWPWVSRGLLLLIFVAGAFAQSSDCSGKEREAALPSSAQIYRDAVELSESLRNTGIVVNCILGSKMEGTFEGESGAAFYRSNHGSFEVLFLPQAASFDRLTISEKRSGQRYSYRFKGPPQPWPANLIESAYRIYFIKNRNKLFVVDNDTQLAETLQRFARSQGQ